MTVKKSFWAALLGVFILLCWGITEVGLVARENDSQLYTRFVKQLNTKPLSEMVALEWRGNSTHYFDPTNPYVRDHLIGQFIPGVLLSKIGFPEDYVMYMLAIFYRLSSLFLWYFLISHYFGSRLGLLCTFIVQLIPISFTYALRANQEPPLLFVVLLMLLSASKLQKNKVWIWPYLFSVVWGLLIKGLGIAPALPLGVVAYVLNLKEESWLPSNQTLLVKTSLFSLLFLSLPLVALIYEWWFESVTTYPFWKRYFEIQIFGRESDSEAASGFLLPSLGYYLGRLPAYAAPWPLLFLIGSFKSFKKRGLFSWPEKKGLFLLLFSCFFYVLFFSVFKRHASRYIFPMYFFMATFCGLYFAKTTLTGQKIENFLKHRSAPFWSLALYGFTISAALIKFALK